MSRSLRACMVCSIIQTSSQFSKAGCPNCSFLDLQGNPDGIAEATSQVFEGMISLAEPTDSWVAKWQRISNYVPGLYAIKVVGQLGDDYIDLAANAGVQYIPRDGTTGEEMS